MSFTETQVIHTLSQSPPRSGVIGRGSYILANGVEVDDKGLIMTIDNKLGVEATVIKPINNVHPTKSHPNARIQAQVTSPFSGLSSSLWLLRTLSYFQTAHFAIVSLINDMNEMMQKKVAHILPLFLYLSLLLLAAQGVVIMMLLVSGDMLPLGIFFLFGCVCSMGFIFCSTAVITEFDRPSLARKMAHMH